MKEITAASASVGLLLATAVSWMSSSRTLEALQERNSFKIKRVLHVKDPGAGHKGFRPGRRRVGICYDKTITLTLAAVL